MDEGWQRVSDAVWERAKGCSACEHHGELTVRLCAGCLEYRRECIEGVPDEWRRAMDDKMPVKWTSDRVEELIAAAKDVASCVGKTESMSVRARLDRLEAALMALGESR